MIPKPIAIAIVCIVTAVWMANFAAQFLVDGYQVDGYLHTVFLVIVGGMLGLSRKGGKNEPPPPPGPDGLPAGGPDDPTPPPDPEPPRGSGAHRASFRLIPWAAT